MTSGSARVEDAWEASVLEELVTRVLAGSSLFEYYLLITMAAPSMKDLTTRERTVKTLLRGFGLDAEALTIQKDLYNLNPCSFLCVEKHYSDSESIKALFPLIDGELHDLGGFSSGFPGLVHRFSYTCGLSPT